MSILSSLWRGVVRPLLDLVLPAECPICGAELSYGQRYICTSCRLNMPLTHFALFDENPMSQRVKALRPDVEHASALFFYSRGSRWSHLIHSFKYRGEWSHGVALGRWLGSELRESEIYRDIDTVVAVPLHPLRQLWRGYNQSDHIAEGVAKAMGISVLRGVVKRRRLNSPQVAKSHDERWSNVEGLFAVSRVEALAGRSILLVDDVFTTGATMMSCAEAILDAVPNCRIWVATVAVSNKEFGYVQD